MQETLLEATEASAPANDTRTMFSYLEEQQQLEKHLLLFFFEV